MRGADLVVRALEDAGARLTFGIPGTHNIELYDALDRSDLVLPVLVTDEQCASFMADGVSRTSGTIGVVNVVPGAGVTHCLSGVAEAFMDNVPLVVLACGIRSDTGRAYQLHDIDQLSILRPVTKAALRPASAADLYATVRRAFTIARSGTPGPVAVEIPAEFYLLSQHLPASDLAFEEDVPLPEATAEQVQAAAGVLNAARRPVIYAGNGATAAAAPLLALAEKLRAPVATTIQGKGVFPEHHQLWLWNGLGASAPPFVRDVTADADAMLAIGCRFSEVGTASYGFTPPANLVHVDVNPDVFHRNFPARLAIASDAGAFLDRLLPLVRAAARDDDDRAARIADGHALVRHQWRSHPSSKGVTPAAFFEALDRAAPDAIYATDSGNGTFLAMEHLRLDGPGRFIGPIDYSCMGYAVPAAIGAKLANRDRDVIAVAGDGALLMTGLELLTASALEASPLVCVLRDGELGQIAQFQRTALDRDTCSVLPPYRVSAFAAAVNADYFQAKDDGDLEPVLARALQASRSGRTVMVEVAIDYSRKTYFTRGVIATNLRRLPYADRLRLLGRAAMRHLGGLLSRER